VRTQGTVRPMRYQWHQRHGVKTADREVAEIHILRVNVNVRASPCAIYGAACQAHVKVNIKAVGSIKQTVPGVREWSS